MLARIPFAEAIEEPLLFKKAFDRQTPGIKAFLKIIYGLPLSDEELVWWHAYNGGGKFDSLGFLEGTEPCGLEYEPREYEDITLILGRRAAKSSGLSSFIVAYECLCGGHKQYVGARQDPVFLQVAQDLVTAKSNLRQFILELLESSPIGAREITDKREATTERANVTAFSIKLKNCGLITVGPPTIKLRGQAIAVCAMDEVGFWQKDKASANPDTEVEAAVRPAMAQFPNRKLVKTSTPMTEEGVLWIAAETGTWGRWLDSGQQAAASRMLVLRGPSAPLAAPHVLPRAYLEQERAKDGEAFRREYLAEFAKSVSGFLSPTLLRAAMTPAMRRRAPSAGRLYIATLDPAFRRDAFAFCIGHMEAGYWVQDFLIAPQGTREKPLSPAMMMRQIAEVCRSYQVSFVFTDQYHQESIQELGQANGMTVSPVYLDNQKKASVWGDFAALLAQGRVQLLDDPECIDELAKMEKHITSAGNVQFRGKKDDRAVVTALNLHKCLELGERLPKPAKEPVPLSTQIRRRMTGHRPELPWWAA